MNERLFSPHSRKRPKTLYADTKVLFGPEKYKDTSLVLTLRGKGLDYSREGKCASTWTWGELKLKMLLS